MEAPKKRTKSEQVEYIVVVICTSSDNDVTYSWTWQKNLTTEEIEIIRKANMTSSEDEGEDYASYCALDDLMYGDNGEVKPVWTETRDNDFPAPISVLSTKFIYT